jgi:hypothetical protein
MLTRRILAALRARASHGYGSWGTDVHLRPLLGPCSARQSSEDNGLERTTFCSRNQGASHQADRPQPSLN